MYTAVIVLGVVVGLMSLATAVLAWEAIQSIAREQGRMTEERKALCDMCVLMAEKFHKAAQVATFNATITKNERIEHAQILLKGEEIRFGQPEPKIPAVNFHNPMDEIDEGVRAEEFRTVSASGQGLM